MVSENELKGIKKFVSKEKAKTYLEYLQKSDSPQWMKEKYIRNYKENGNDQAEESF